jgi:hypothetical protein
VETVYFNCKSYIICAVKTRLFRPGRMSTKNNESDSMVNENGARKEVRDDIHR